VSQTRRVGAIVEGYGDVEAVPILVRRVALEIYGIPVDVQKPHRLARSKIGIAAELDRALQLHVARVGPDGGVLVVFDADDDDPIEVTSRVEAIAHERHGRVAVAVAVKEFEAWFLAALPSLVGHRALRNDAHYDRDPEGRRNCKKELELLMTESYSETRHQSAFSAVMDLAQARRRSPSFERFVAAVGSVLDVGAD
jgi:hypothetical protein